jgi:hypothetical protein
MLTIIKLQCIQPLYVFPRYGEVRNNILQQGNHYNTSWNVNTHSFPTPTSTPTPTPLRVLSSSLVTITDLNTHQILTRKQMFYKHWYYLKSSWVSSVLVSNMKLYWIFSVISAFFMVFTKQITTITKLYWNYWSQPIYMASSVFLLFVAFFKNCEWLFSHCA